MNNHLRGIAAAVLATLAVGYSAQSLAAQDAVTSRSTVVNSEGQVTHCVSTESGRTYCGRPHMRYTIVGTAPTTCVEGRTWGFGRSGRLGHGRLRGRFQCRSRQYSYQPHDNGQQ